MLKKDYLTILPNHLELRNRRAQAAKVPVLSPDAPLSEQESRAFEIVHKQLIEKSALPSAEAEKLIQSCIDKYGKKAMLNFFIEKPLTNKLSLVWPIYLLFGGAIYFVFPAYFRIVLFGGGLLAIAGFINAKRLEQQSRATWESRRQERLNAVLTEGIKI